jgi:hypothetical protein
MVKAVALAVLVVTDLHHLLLVHLLQEQVAVVVLETVMVAQAVQVEVEQVLVDQVLQQLLELQTLAAVEEELEMFLTQVVKLQAQVDLV